MPRILDQNELNEYVAKLREAAMTIHLCTSCMRSTTPEKNVAIDKIKELSRGIIDLLEVVEK
jgi:hypothetical protein